MTKLFRSRQNSDETRPQKGRVSPSGKKERVPIWQALLLPLASVLFFFLLLEGGLTLFGVEPALKSQDPFVGFAGNVPLFIPDPAREEPWMKTAPNKLTFFNPQNFPLEKAPGTYRIFTLGGSTTYGRPYSDTTSFSGWLRELLPVADKSRKWEVINAGGISYASYRVAHLMEELVNYQPDLFIVYTGHNEFLEERTYGQVKEIPSAIRSTVTLLSKTRTWAAMAGALQKTGLSPETVDGHRDRLGEKVDAVLDRSAGLERYTRDDPLREMILKHYRISLEHMVALARSAGAGILFVTPASSLKNCSPFKSEHTQGLDPSAREKSERLLSQAKVAIGLKEWDAAQALLEKAVTIDPQHSELQYRLGQALLALHRYGEAKTAFLRARDEDICPLRALTPMRRIVGEVAGEQGIPFVDFVGIIEKRMEEKKGHSIPGKELFLDHVHPTIEGHKILALALLEALTANRIVQTGPDWSEDSIAGVAAKIEGKIDQKTHSRALANLARVLLWAGKSEDAARLALRAQKRAGHDHIALVDSASILTSVYLDSGQDEKARQLMYSTLEKAPGAIEIRLKLGQALIQPALRQLEEAAANLLMVIQQMPNYDAAYADFALAMARQGRLGIAYDSAIEALDLNPKNARAQAILSKIRGLQKQKKMESHPFQVKLDVYPTHAPRKLTMLRRNSAGGMIPHGIQVEFHENGRISRFLDLVGGQVHGTEKIWDERGALLSHVEYKHGRPAREIELAKKD